MNASFCLFDTDRRTRDLVSAFLTYKGYETSVLDPASDPGNLLPGKQGAILVADLAVLAACCGDIASWVNDRAGNQISIVYGAPEMARSVHGLEQLIFLPKPLNLDELESVALRALECQALKVRKPDLQSADDYPHFLCSTIIGKSRKMLSLFEMIEKVSESSATVLIQGESGTGKELAARAIHQLSDRNNKNFVPVNCAAIPDDLLESELFGHVKGSFTGAYANRIGRFEMADKGTLFLDEIGDMKASLQVKLLRVLQTKEFEPVGSPRSQKVDVRIIAASNKNLEDLVVTRDFREDLYYRLSVIPITIPPLRERREDIPLLINHFQAVFSRDRRRLVKGFSREAIEVLCEYQWPGNVRELENLVERMVTMKESGMITVDDLPEKYLGTTSVSPRQLLQTTEVTPTTVTLPAEGICLNSAVDEFEKRLILQALQRTGGNKKEAAAVLNLKRTTLIEKLKKKNIQFP